MTYREIEVTIKLHGWFPRIYNHNKPENISDESYINAMVSSWLLNKDDKNHVSKTDKEKGSASWVYMNI